jgi:hypothetical protein
MSGQSRDSIFGRLAVRQTAFEECQYFKHIATNPPRSWLIEQMPRMGFWIFTFQDILRLIEGRVQRQDMRAIASHIRRGDRGHDNWFVADLAHLGLAMPSLREAFASEHQAGRLASFSLVSEVFRATDDRLLVVLLLALESASYVFFDRMTQYLDHNGLGELRYFGRTHLDAELKHGIVEAEMDRLVEESLSPDASLQEEALALIDRVFDAFGRMFAPLAPA